MTLEEKLKKFKSGTAGLHVTARETWDKLMKTLEVCGYKWDEDLDPGIWEYCTGIVLGGNSENILEITEEDFTVPSETAESVMESIEEVKADLEFYRELFKKYNVVMTGNLEPTMRAKLESLIKRRVVS